MWSSVIVLCLFSAGVLSQNTPRIPPNPCPLVFNYYSDNDNTIFGEIIVPNDGQMVLKMEVNASYIGLFSQRNAPRLKLELTTQKNYITQSKQLTYKLTFTRQDVIPRITQVKFNGRVYCSGPQETLTSDGVSNLWVYKETTLQMYTYYPDRPMITKPMAERPTVPAFIPPRTTTQHYPDEVWTSRPRPGAGNNGHNPAPLIDQDDPYCGVSDRTMNLIVDGASTVQNEFPWVAALYRWHELNYEFTCTATLIDRNHVVTAAHCIKFYNSYLIEPRDILLIFGKSHLEHWAEQPDTIKRTVVNVEVHPDYRQYSGHGDVAVLTLDKPVDYSRSVKPICLWRDSDDIRYVVGQYGTVAGWGKDDRQDKYLVDSKKVEMPIVSEDTCVRSNTDFQKLVSEKTFCAGERNGRGPCTGDSGSPFMLQKNGRWTLRGLVSQAIINRQNSQCNLREYIVFADLAKYNGWIRSKLY